jgi:hypothetical protein
VALLRDLPLEPADIFGPAIELLGRRTDQGLAGIPEQLHGGVVRFRDGSIARREIHRVMGKREERSVMVLSLPQRGLGAFARIDLAGDGKHILRVTDPPVGDGDLHGKRRAIPPTMHPVVVQARTCGVPRVYDVLCGGLGTPDGELQTEVLNGEGAKLVSRSAKPTARRGIDIEDLARRGVRDEDRLAGLVEEFAKAGEVPLLLPLPRRPLGQGFLQVGKLGRLPLQSLLEPLPLLAQTILDPLQARDVSRDNGRRHDPAFPMIGSNPALVPRRRIVRAHPAALVASCRARGEHTLEAATHDIVLLGEDVFVDGGAENLALWDPWKLAVHEQDRPVGTDDKHEVGGIRPTLLGRGGTQTLRRYGFRLGLRAHIPALGWLSCGRSLVSRRGRGPKPVVQAVNRGSFRRPPSGTVLCHWAPRIPSGTSGVGWRRGISNR